MGAIYPGDLVNLQMDARVVRVRLRRTTEENRASLQMTARAVQVVLQSTTEKGKLVPMTIVDVAEVRADKGELAPEITVGVTDVGAKDGELVSGVPSAPPTWVRRGRS